tara:strand:- start:735 stop:1202 length:468 start_codon:yes stop_codon:yes gene_type:complete
MNNNDLLTLLFGFILGYFAHQMKQMCGGRLVEGVDDDFSCKIDWLAGAGWAEDEPPDESCESLVDKNRDERIDSKCWEAYTDAFTHMTRPTGVCSQTHCNDPDRGDPMGSCQKLRADPLKNACQHDENWPSIKQSIQTVRQKYKIGGPCDWRMIN